MHKNNIFKYQEQPDRLMDKVCWVDINGNLQEVKLRCSTHECSVEGGYTILHHGNFGVFIFQHFSQFKCYVKE